MAGYNRSTYYWIAPSGKANDLLQVMCIMELDPPHILIHHDIENQTAFGNQKMEISYEHTTEKIQQLVNFVDIFYLHFCVFYGGEFSDIGLTFQDSASNRYDDFVDCPLLACDCDPNSSFNMTLQPGVRVNLPILSATKETGHHVSISMSPLRLVSSKYHHLTLLQWLATRKMRWAFSSK